MAEIWAWLTGALVALGLMSRPEMAAVHQGYVEGEYLLIAAPTAGPLATLDVERGQTIAAGAPLFSLDPTKAQADVDRAAAALAQARAQATDLRKGKRPEELDMVRASRAQAMADLELARLRLGREQQLVESKARSIDSLDEAKAEFTRLEARIAELDAELQTAELPARTDQIAAADAATGMAEADLARAKRTLAELAPTAPAAALVEDTLFDPGEWVDANKPVVSLLPPERIKLRFFVPQAVVGSLKTGQVVRFACDGCASGLTARISFIARAAEYTPPVIYSVGSRQKLVFMVEARPTGDPARLHPGQPVDVTLGP